MAYEAHNCHAGCIALYQQIEKTHPSVSIRCQVAELRYILQAPQLKILYEEMVTIWWKSYNCPNTGTYNQE